MIKDRDLFLLEMKSHSIRPHFWQGRKKLKATVRADSNEKMSSLLADLNM